MDKQVKEKVRERVSKDPVTNKILHPSMLSHTVETRVCNMLDRNKQKGRVLEEKKESSQKF